MELVNIEKLLEKYFEASTTVAEEQELQQYFAQEDVAPHLQQYAPMFQYFTSAKEERYTKPVPLTPKKRIGYLKWISVAAVAILSVGIYLQVDFPEDSLTDKEQADLRFAMSLFSKSFNKGTQQVGYLNAFNKGSEELSRLAVFNEGTQTISHINEFKNTTNKFLHNKQ